MVYPDAVVIAIAPEFWNGREDPITNPLLIVEVFSKSTRQHDKGSKFMLYQNLPSFVEYVLVEQDECKVTVWSKVAADKWQFVTYTNLAENVVLQSMEHIKIAVADIYENIIF